MSRIKKWNLRFVANNLALLLVLQEQVKKELEKQETNRAATRSASLTGTPKATDLKQAFIKLWNAYKKTIRYYVMAENEKEKVVHRTPSLSLQLNGTHNHDHVLWGSSAKIPSTCLICTHASTMPTQLHKE